MSWRTVVISNRCKLEYKMGYMVVRGDEVRRVLLDEISALIIENTGVSLTAYLLAALTEKKIKVVFCDEKRNPAAELVPLAGSYDSSAKIRDQIAWGSAVKGAVWTEIIREKIQRQAELLKKLGKENEYWLLCDYLSQLEFADATNREGHAAKVYFHHVFGNDFSRADTTNPINAALNYGYSILLSTVNREISAAGYLLQLGLFHDNMFNPFNLGCDIMEPLRVFIDAWVCKQRLSAFGPDQKKEILSLFHTTVEIGDTKQVLPNAIRLYIRSVFRAINETNPLAIQFIKYEI